jgi:nucleotide-binding universal stress UspA family protein
MMTAYEINKVLVPLDFSPVADSALDTAVEICKRQGATLTLLHVVESSLAIFGHKAGIAATSILPELVESAQANLYVKCAEITSVHRVRTNCMVVTGNPALEITHSATEKKIDLIVMGTHGATGIREFLIGSNAYRVVKNAACPVLTVPGTTPWREFRKILFPVRLVPHALAKYDVLKPIISRTGSVRISGIVSVDDERGITEMKALVTQVKNRMLLDNVICGTDVHVCGNAAKQVYEIAKAENPDLIVITATIDTSLKEFFLSPYTQDIINHSQYPVLSVRPKHTIEADESFQPVTAISLTTG